MLKRGFVVFSFLLLTGCTTFINQTTTHEAVDWVDTLMVLDNKYTYNDEATATLTDIVIGEELGEVTYMMADNAKSNHQMENGHAAFLSVGTKIYELRGYDSSYRVIADNKIYEIATPEKATVLGDFLDLEGKVDVVTIESNIDGSDLYDFSKEDSAAFVEELLSLKYVNYANVDTSTSNEENRVFVRIYLEDDTSTSFVYWLETGGLSLGAYESDTLRVIFEKARK